MKKIDFNAGWSVNGKSVTLPHDAMIGESRSAEKSTQGHGYFHGGVYEYIKTFAVPDDWVGKPVLLEFEGVYRNAEVYINGRLAGGRPYGYIPFFIDTAPFLQFGKDNTVKVVADNSELPNSRWYSGSGIYRPVWLHIGEKDYIPAESIKITTLSYSPTRILVETEHIGGNVSVEISDGGNIIAKGSGSSVELDIPNAKLWSDETPYLYTAKVTLDSGDETTVTFGIRKIEWSNKGLFINGKETLLRGGCVHHDNGILGACCYAESEERRVRILKETGFNAIRSAHNPISKAMLNACDKYGVYVMDEAWDMWYKAKSKNDYASEFEANYHEDIKAIVRRDYNHPSVIMYSIGNEVTEPHDERGLAMCRTLTDTVHKLDNTRPVTMGLNPMLLFMAAQGNATSIADAEAGKAESFKMPEKMDSTAFNQMAQMIGVGMNQRTAHPDVDAVSSPCLDMLDIAGYNYASARYPLDGEAHPDRVIIGAETFPQDIAKNWAMVKRYPYLIGDFMWTAWDYLGEAGIGAWAYTEDANTFDKPYPWLLADVGAIDILGHIGAEAEYAAAVWGLRDTPYIGVQPVNHPGVTPYKGTWRSTNAIASWAWQGCEGNDAIIEVYSDADTVELMLDGNSLGKESVNEYKAVFTTKYNPGTLTAVAYGKDGAEVSRSCLTAPKGALGIQMIPEKTSVTTGEIAYVNIDLAYENGVIESNADCKLTVTVTGGELLAFGSANPRTEENYLDGAHTTYYGRSQAVVRSDTAGEITLAVEGEGLHMARAKIIIE
ncbi:MAG: DUF4982 domain-containing protein [Oscillospiraceae bacterium]|nr:DUF4982 domain-containing protein [Oscillospiraceae bacterium]